MFYNCTSLVKAVDILPAMTLKTQCYHNMFRNCSKLVMAPELPALDLVSNCYYAMFNKCTSLNYIKAMFLTIPSSTTTSGWVSNVSASGTFVKNKNATWDVVGDNGIPTGWAVQYYAELITFTIDGVEYQAEEGMTWEQWVNSDYNTLQLTITWGYITDVNGYNSIRIDDNGNYYDV